jgi:hypothetical protein
MTKLFHHREASTRLVGVSKKVEIFILKSVIEKNELKSQIAWGGKRRREKLPWISLHCAAPNTSQPRLPQDKSREKGESRRKVEIRLKREGGRPVES